MSTSSRSEQRDDLMVEYAPNLRLIKNARQLSVFSLIDPLHSSLEEAVRELIERWKSMLNGPGSYFYCCSA